MSSFQELEAINGNMTTNSLQTQNKDSSNMPLWIHSIENHEYGIKKIEEIDDDFDITRKSYFKYYDIFKLNYSESNNKKLIIRYIDAPLNKKVGFHIIIYNNNSKILSQFMSDDKPLNGSTVVIKVFNNKVIIIYGNKDVDSFVLCHSPNIFNNSYEVKEEINKKKIDYMYISNSDLYLFENEKS